MFHVIRRRRERTRLYVFQFVRVSSKRRVHGFCAILRRVITKSEKRVCLMDVKPVHWWREQVRGGFFELNTSRQIMNLVFRRRIRILDMLCHDKEVLSRKIIGGETIGLEPQRRVYVRSENTREVQRGAYWNPIKLWWNDKWNCYYFWVER